MSPAILLASETPDKAFIVNRPVYTQQEFDDRHGARNMKTPILSKVRGWIQRAKSRCNPVQAKKQAFKFFPFFNIMRKYDIKGWLISDIIAGITVGIMHIPQGMAYAVLATLPPVYGLYVSFFPTLIYFFFGTSRHISMGTIAIVSLLTGNLLNKAIAAGQTSTVTQSNNLTTSLFITTPSVLATTMNVGLNVTTASAASVALSAEAWQRVYLAAAAAFLVGLIQLLMGICQLGFLTRYLSDSMIAGYTVGAAFLVFTSQIKSVLGIKIPTRSGIFNVPLTYVDIFTQIPFCNGPTVGIAAFSILILAVFKEHVNPRVMKKIKFPIPTELLVIVAGALASYFLNLNSTQRVTIVGNIPSGIPAPAMPQLSLLSNYIGDVITLVIIAYSVCISLSKLLAKKHGYDVDPNQELLAYGITNLLSSLFFTYPAAASISRSAVQESMGGKTQLVGIISSSLLLFVLLFIGPLFKTVPTACLAAIILVALKGMFMHAAELPRLWRVSKWDFWTWIISAASTVILDVDLGLYIGIGFSALSVILRTQSPSSHVLGRVTDTDLYKNVKAYDDCREVEGIRIYRYEGSLYYACGEHFRESIFRKTGVNPRKRLIIWRKLERKLRAIKKHLEAARQKAVVQEVGQVTGDRGASGEPDGTGVPEITVSYRASIGNNQTFPNNSMAAVVISTHHIYDEIRELEEKEATMRARLDEAKNLGINHVIIDCSTWGYMDYAGVSVLSTVIEDFKEVNIKVFLANPKTDIRAILERSDFYAKNSREIIYVSVHDAVLSALYSHTIDVQHGVGTSEGKQEGACDAVEMELRGEMTNERSSGAILPVEFEDDTTVKL